MQRLGVCGGGFVWPRAPQEAVLGEDMWAVLQGGAGGLVWVVRVPGQMHTCWVWGTARTPCLVRRDGREDRRSGSQGACMRRLGPAWAE